MYVKTNNLEIFMTQNRLPIDEESGRHLSGILSHSKQWMNDALFPLSKIQEEVLMTRQNVDDALTLWCLKSEGNYVNVSVDRESGSRVNFAREDFPRYIPSKTFLNLNFYTRPHS